MARIDNLTNYLTDVSQAIKDKKGDQTAIPAQNFDTEIANLPSGGGGLEDGWDTVTPVTNNNIKVMIKKIPVLNTSNTKNFTSFFEFCKNLEEVPSIDTSKGDNLNSMFKECKKITTIPLLNTSKAINMGGMFSQCNALTTIPLLDTSKVTNMSGIFRYCTALTSIPILDTTKVTDMSLMFNGCSSLETIPLLNTSNVTDMQWMFSNMNNFKKMPPLDISKVNNMQNMFYNSSTVQEINLNKAPILPDCSMSSAFSGIPANCLIRVYDQASKDMVLASRSDLTNVVIEPYTGE